MKKVSGLIKVSKKSYSLWDLLMMWINPSYIAPCEREKNEN